MATDRWRAGLSVTVVAILSLPVIGCANSPPKRLAYRQPVKMRLLEFLGSADPMSDDKHSDGGNWMTYLSKLDLGKAARTSGKHGSASAPKSATEPDNSRAGNR